MNSSLSSKLYHVKREELYRLNLVEAQLEKGMKNEEIAECSWMRLVSRHHVGSKLRVTMAPNPKCVKTNPKLCRAFGMSTQPIQTLVGRKYPVQNGIFV